MRTVIAMVLKFKRVLQEKSSAKRFEIGSHQFLGTADTGQARKEVIRMLQRRLFPEELRI